MTDGKTAVDRRRFFKRTALVAGGAAVAAPAAMQPAAAVGGPGASNGTTGRTDVAAAPDAPSKAGRLPREVWIATVSQHDVRADTPRAMVRRMLRRMEEVVAFRPDIICLPEAFAVANLTGKRLAMAEVAEKPIGELARPLAEFARKHHCYVVCPMHTKHGDRIYNTAVFIDRSGKLLGEYHKIHPTRGEMEAGISPGPLEPPVFRTDFGVVGAQICFDIEWTDGWRKLEQAGAEIVFWPSAFAGGQMVNAKAWQHKYCVVSSTQKDTSKICDISGETVASTSRWNRSTCASINLEKAFLHTWPYVRRFGDIEAKYGRDVVIRTFPEEEWSIIESRSPDVKIADIMKEFDLKTHAEHIAAADEAQCRCRDM